jgi:hypothetical protein
MDYNCGMEDAPKGRPIYSDEWNDWSGQAFDVLTMGPSPDEHNYSVSWNGRTGELRVLKTDEKPLQLVAIGRWRANATDNDVPDVLPGMRDRIGAKMPGVWEFYLRKGACN